MPKSNKRVDYNSSLVTMIGTCDDIAQRVLLDAGSLGRGVVLILHNCRIVLCRFKVYQGDFFLYKQEFESELMDGIWDRGSLVAVNIADREK